MKFSTNFNFFKIFAILWVLTVGGIKVNFSGIRKKFEYFPNFTLWENAKKIEIFPRTTEI